MFSIRWDDASTVCICHWGKSWIPTGTCHIAELCLPEFSWASCSFAMPFMPVSTTDQSVKCYRSVGLDNQHMGDIPRNFEQSNGSSITCFWVQTNTKRYLFFSKYAHLSRPLRQKCHHFNEIFITGCTESCQTDDFMNMTKERKTTLNLYFGGHFDGFSGRKT